MALYTVLYIQMDRTVGIALSYKAKPESTKKGKEKNQNSKKVWMVDGKLIASWKIHVWVLVMDLLYKKQ